MSLEEALRFFVLGLGSGAIYAALGVGVVMTYRASGLVNFAHGAMALYTVAVMGELQHSGDLILPVGTVSFGDPLGLWPAVAVTVAYSALQSAMLYLACFAPLHQRPPLAKIVASVGLMLAMQSLINLRFHRPRQGTPILPNEQVEILGGNVGRDRLWLAVIVMLVAAAVAAWGAHTMFGKATRAAAEDERGAYLVGLRPVRIALVNWVLAGVMATVVGVLFAPMLPLEPSTFTLLIIPALAAALLGRLSSILVTAIAGLALGGTQEVIGLAALSYDWLPQTGLREGLPFVVVAVVMVVLGRRLPGRATLLDGRLPSAHAGKISPVAVAVVVVAAAACVLVFPSAWRLALITSMVAAILCLGLVVLTGFVGQISLAHMTLAGVAGFSLSRFADGAGVPFPIAPLLAVGVTVIAGVVLGYPALRVRGLHLAVVSIAAAMAIVELIFKNPDFTGGTQGSAIPQPELFGLSLGIRGEGGEFPRPIFGIFVLVCLTGAALGVARLRRSDLGRRMLAVRTDERAATAAGIDVARIRLIALVISSALGGLGGCLIGYQQGQLSFASFTVFSSLLIVTVVYLGGIASVTGALLGGTLYAGGLGPTILERWLHLGRYETVILGFALVAVAIANPDGIAGALRHSGSRVAHLIGHRSSDDDNAGTDDDRAGPAVAEPADSSTEVMA